MTEHDPDGNAVLLAILALLVDEREARLAERPEASKTETILSDCGLDATAIAAWWARNRARCAPY